MDLVTARFQPQEQWDKYRSMPEQDMYDYSPFLREAARGNVLEIGVCAGVSTAALLLGLDDKNDGHLWSVDINPECADLYEHPRWTFICGDSREVVLDIPPIDLLFIDGNHSYSAASSDLNRFSQLVAPGGTIMMHDVQPSQAWFPRIQAENWYPIEECRQAWKDFCAAHPAWPSRVVKGMTGMGVIVKQDACQAN